MPHSLTAIVPNCRLRINRFSIIRDNKKKIHGTVEFGFTENSVVQYIDNDIHWPKVWWDEHSCCIARMQDPCLLYSVTFQSSSGDRTHYFCAQTVTSQVQVADVHDSWQTSDDHRICLIKRWWVERV